MVYSKGASLLIAVTAVKCMMETLGPPKYMNKKYEKNRNC